MKKVLFILLAYMAFTFGAAHITSYETESSSSHTYPYELNNEKFWFDAINMNSAELVELLLVTRIDINQKDIYGDTALHIAAQKGYRELTELLISKKADIFQVNAQGKTALQLAEQNVNEEIANILKIEAEKLKRADSDASKSEEIINTSKVQNGFLIPQTPKKNGFIAPAAVNKSLKPKDKKNDALMVAISNNSLDLVESLLKGATEVDPSALYLAIKNDNSQMVKILLSHFDIYHRDSAGDTLLNRAIYNNAYKVAKLLLDIDYTRFQKREANNSPRNKSILLAQYSSTKDGFTPLHVAAKINDVKMAQLLQRYFAPIEARDKLGNTPLHIAISENSIDVVKELLKKSAISSLDNNRNTPIHKAVMANNIEILKLLIRLNAIINAKGLDGDTPLHIAAKNGFVEIGLELLKNRANLNITNDFGQQPLHLAAGVKGNIKMIKMLVEKGANLYFNDRFRNFPLMVSLGIDDQATIYLLEKGHCNYSPEHIEKVILHAWNHNFYNTLKLLLQYEPFYNLIINDKKKYITIAMACWSSDLVNQLMLPEKIFQNKEYIFLAATGKYDTPISPVSPNISKLKDLMPKCTMAVKYDSDKRNLLHILFMSSLDALQIETIVRLVAVNPDLLFMPDKNGVTPIGLSALNANNGKMKALGLLFKLAFGDDKFMNAKKPFVNHAPRGQMIARALKQQDRLGIKKPTSKLLEDHSDSDSDDIATKNITKRRRV